MSEERDERREFGRIFRRGDTWYVRYRVGGREFQESTRSTSKRKAQDLLAQRRTEMGHGVFVEPSAKRTTFEDLAEMLRAHYRNNGLRSLGRVETSLKHLSEHLGHLRAHVITYDRVERYKKARLEEGATPATIQNELAALSKALRLAHKAKKLAQVPPIDRFRLDNAREGFFEEAEFRAVLAKLPEFVKHVAEVAYLTGWRVPSELLTRQWRHVDFDAGWLRLEPGEAKNREGRLFPINVVPRLRQVLEEQRERTRAVERATGTVVPWLFHRGGAKLFARNKNGAVSPLKSVRRAWAEACVAAGLGHEEERPGRKKPKPVPHVILHDFRRTAVRNLERAGVSRSAAMKMTGHRTEAVYRRYAIVTEADLKEAGAKLAALHQVLAERAEAERTVVPIERRGTAGGQQR